MWRACDMVETKCLHDTGECLWCITWFLISGYQAIHILKALAYIGLQHVHLSLKYVFAQLGIHWCSVLLTNMKHLQNGKYQQQAWTKDALVFPVQEMYLVSACIWNGNISNTVHNLKSTSKAGHSSQVNTLYLWLWTYIYRDLSILHVWVVM